jgi:hypothetical protein
MHILIEYIFFPCYAVLNVIFIQIYFKSLFATKFYESPFILINGWFLFHIYNTLLLVMCFPKTSIRKMMKLVVLWEILENIIVPTLGIMIQNQFMMTQFKEQYNDIMGDLIAPLPSLYYLYWNNHYKNNMIKNKKYLKIKHL